MSSFDWDDKDEFELEAEATEVKSDLFDTLYSDLVDYDDYVPIDDDDREVENWSEEEYYSEPSYMQNFYIEED